MKDEEGKMWWGNKNVIRIATEFYKKLYETTQQEQDKETREEILAERLNRLKSIEIPFPPPFWRGR